MVCLIWCRYAVRILGKMEQALARREAHHAAAQQPPEASVDEPNRQCVIFGLNAEAAFLGRANVPSDVRAARVAVIYAAVAMPAFRVALGVRFAPPAFMRGRFPKVERTRR